MHTEYKLFMKKTEIYLDAYNVILVKYLLSHYEDICLIYEYMLKHDTYVFLCINSKELLLKIFYF